MSYKGSDFFSIFAQVAPKNQGKGIFTYNQTFPLSRY